MCTYLTALSEILLLSGLTQEPPLQQFLPAPASHYREAGFQILVTPR